jgi:hypothetical protein
MSADDSDYVANIRSFTISVHFLVRSSMLIRTSDFILACSKESLLLTYHVDDQNVCTLGSTSSTFMKKGHYPGRE